MIYDIVFVLANITAILGILGLLAAVVALNGRRY